MGSWRTSNASLARGAQASKLLAVQPRHCPDRLERIRDGFLAAVVRRFSWIKWIGVGVVAVTGIIQWFTVWPHVVAPAAYAASFVLKMGGAVGLGTITFLLALPSEHLRGMRRRRGLWAGINIACGLAILVGAALMRAVAKM